jgi:hypothetical protein
MATRPRRRRRHHKPVKHHSRRRRRMGAMALNAANPMVQIGSIAAGFLLVGKPLNDMIDKLAKIDATTDASKKKIVAGVEVGLGALLLLKKGKKSMIEVVGGGILAGAGLKRALTEFGIISGFQQVPVLSGYKNVPVLGGYNVPSPAGLNGYNTRRSVSQQIMGSTNRTGSCCMEG